ncbi:hypothetical protein BW41_02578 [Sphingomonas sp. RIT328]|nr:hypothetical protein BW41_02578 [Sphingomonas sp. RIT328]
MQPGDLAVDAGERDRDEPCARLTEQPRADRDPQRAAAAAVQRGDRAGGQIANHRGAMVAAAHTAEPDVAAHPQAVTAIVDDQRDMRLVERGAVERAAEPVALRIAPPQAVGAHPQPEQPGTVGVDHVDHQLGQCARPVGRIGHIAFEAGAVPARQPAIGGEPDETLAVLRDRARHAGVRDRIVARGDLEEQIGGGDPGIGARGRRGRRTHRRSDHRDRDHHRRETIAPRHDASLLRGG